MSIINDYTIFGERNSGTNYLAKVLNNYLALKSTKKFGFKHWYLKDHFPRGRPNKTTDNECLVSLKNSDDTLFIFTVRNPYDWCGAMKTKPYHMKETNHSSLYDFISNKYISYEDHLPADHGPLSQSPWQIDEVTNKYFIEEADNLIELRNSKNNHFYALKNKVQHFHIIRQENLEDDIQNLVSKFGLETKTDQLLIDYEPPIKYVVDKKSRQFINHNLNNKVDSLFYLNKSRDENYNDVLNRNVNVIYIPISITP